MVCFGCPESLCLSCVPQVVKEGSKRVVLINFGDICKTLNRTMDHGSELHPARRSLHALPWSGVGRVRGMRAEGVCSAVHAACAAGGSRKLVFLISAV